MPLGTRKLDIRALIREHGDEPATRTIHVQIDPDGGVQSLAAGKDVHQASDNDNVYPPGFFCKQAANDEEIKVRCDGNWVIIAINVAAPADVLAARTREPVLWDPSGNRMRCNGADGTETTVAAGGVHKIRTADAATKPIAYAGSGEGDANSSHVAAGASLELWTQGVENDIAAIKADLASVLQGSIGGLLWDMTTAINALALWGATVTPPYGGATAPYPSGESLSPETVGPIAEDSNHSYISSGTDKGEIEPEEAP